jgi:hypothetical protein
VRQTGRVMAEGGLADRICKDGGSPLLGWYEGNVWFVPPARSA